MTIGRPKRPKQVVEAAIRERLSTIYTRYFADGREARSIENKALEMFDTVDTGIEGFRKEATSIVKLPHLLAIVSGGCHETS